MSAKIWLTVSIKYEIATKFTLNKFSFTFVFLNFIENMKVVQQNLPEFFHLEGTAQCYSPSVFPAKAISSIFVLTGLEFSPVKQK